MNNESKNSKDNKRMNGERNGSALLKYWPVLVVLLSVTFSAGMFVSRTDNNKDMTSYIREVRELRGDLNDEISRSKDIDSEQTALIKVTMENLSKRVENLEHRTDAIYNMIVEIYKDRK